MVTLVAYHGRCVSVWTMPSLHEHLRNLRRFLSEAWRVETVPVSRIRPTQEAQRIDQGLVKRIVSVLETGWDLSVIPPVRGYFYTDGVELTDGHHRLVAAQTLGLATVPVINEAAMQRGDKSRYAAAVRRYRKLVEHPLA